MATQLNTPGILVRDITLNSTLTHFILYTLFFCSGSSALMYQVIWQRMLFTVFGVDLVSTTIIISVFMFGLGIGGLVGGWLADRMPSRLLMLYVGIELLIALFGFLSTNIIKELGTILLTDSELVTAIVSYIILAFPTLLMGATFPILVTHVNQKIQNIGNSVGGLYFANTLGGAVGAYMAGFILLFCMDMAGVIYCAATLNVAIAIIAFLIFRS